MGAVESSRTVFIEKNSSDQDDVIDLT